MKCAFGFWSGTGDDYCTACFDGSYRVPVDDVTDKIHFDGPPPGKP
jgi:hypothetical protein